MKRAGHIKEAGPGTLDELLIAITRERFSSLLTSHPYTVS